MVTSYSVDNDNAFRKAINDARTQVGDLSIPLRLIAKDFYKSERSIFLLKSNGQYPDLSNRYKILKQKQVGFVYPILKRTGRLERSVTDPSDSNAINMILNKSVLVIGTKATSNGRPYPRYLQDGTSRMPMRKFLFIGPEARRFATSEQVGRLSRWTNILAGYVAQVMQQRVGSEGAA